MSDKVYLSDKNAIWHRSTLLRYYRQTVNEQTEEIGFVNSTLGKCFLMIFLYHFLATLSRGTWIANFTIFDMRCYLWVVVRLERDISGAARIQFTIPISFLMILRIRVLYFTTIIKPEVWPICHCLGLGHKTMLYSVCLCIYLWICDQSELLRGNIRVLVVFAPNLVPCHWHAVLLPC